MNKQERIAKLMELLQASLDGKEIEQVDCGHYYPSDISGADFGNVHQFRVKPNVVTKKYRVALFKDTRGNYCTKSYDERNDEKVGEMFIQWLSDWQTYTVEE